MCNVGDKKPVYLCSLLPRKMETCSLNIEFEEYDEVTFSVEGPHTIHLSGFFYGEKPDSDEDYSESYPFYILIHLCIFNFISLCYKCFSLTRFLKRF